MLSQKLIPQFGKNKYKVVAEGYLCIDNDSAYFFKSNDIFIDSLIKIDIIFFNVNTGIKIKGYHFVKVDKLGNRQYEYMEWFCPFIIKEEQIKK